MLDLDTIWIIFCAILVFFMQTGFMFLEAGSVRYKNVENMLFKNLSDICLGCMAWFFVGWGVAFGTDGSGSFIDNIIGRKDWALTESNNHQNWFFQWAFCSTCATIVSGSVAERMRLECYFLNTVILTIINYPIVVYWVWSGSGFLSAGQEYGIIDFAGSGVVHMTGGLTGLVGAIMIG
eukprot:UN29379